MAVESTGDWQIKPHYNESKKHIHTATFKIQFITAKNTTMLNYETLIMGALKGETPREKFEYLKRLIENQNPAKRFVAEVNKLHPGTFPDTNHILSHGNNLPFGHSGE